MPNYRTGNKNAMGKAMIRKRFKGKDPRATQTVMAHTTEMNDGYDWAKMGSVTAQGQLEEFLTTAEMAGTDFTAEKQNLSVIDLTAVGLQNQIDRRQVDLKKRLATQDSNKHRLRIPRRPPWNKNTTATELEDAERESFLHWRRTLAELEETEDVIMTPYERNISFWRQLWRVVERCDVIVQIVDARNPLLFWCPDIETYVKEQGPHKRCILLLNKSDLLTEEKRLKWGEHLDKIGVEFAFFSALAEGEAQERANDLVENTEKEEESISWDAVDSQLLERPKPKDQRTPLPQQPPPPQPIQPTTPPTSTVDSANGSEKKEEQRGRQRQRDRQIQMERERNEETSKQASDSTTKDEVEIALLEQLNLADSKPTPSTDANDSDNNTNTDSDDEDEGGDDTLTDLPNPHAQKPKNRKVPLQTRCQLFSAKRLLDFFHTVAAPVRLVQPISSNTSSNPHNNPCIGMVGYPNVGKSSTINALCTEKKTSVSSTPGRTKHFQTILFDDLVLCDCPGLVFPTFASTKAEMVCNGILPIDQLQDHLGPTQHICDTVDRAVLNAIYGIKIILPAPDEANQQRPPTAIELLECYGRARGMMSGSGDADGPRCSRYLLKDYVKGKLLYCHDPPLEGMTKVARTQAVEAAANYNSYMAVGPKHDRKYVSAVDESFFGQNGIRALVRDYSKPLMNVVDGKASKHHNKRGRKEKQRRMAKAQSRGMNGFVTL